MKTALSIAALAAACFTASTPAMAQRRAAPPPPMVQRQSPDDARFAAAQQRFDNEYRLYQQEVERYRNSRQMSWQNQGGPGPRYDDPRYSNNDDRYNNDPRYNGGRWDDRDEGDYDAGRYYREGPNYRERVLAQDERVYRGRDGRYYCKRPDGTTGLIVGAVAGGVLGNIIDGGHSRTAGTLLGALIGGAVGQQVDANNQQQIRCR